MKLLLWILVALLLFLVLLFWVPIGIICRADTAKPGADFILWVRVLGVKIRVFPQKKRLPDIRKFRRDALERRFEQSKRKAAKKEAAKAKKQAKKEAKANDPKQIAKKAARPKRSIRHIIKLVLALIRVLCTRFGRYLRVDIKYFDIVAAAKEPADTAILYGWICAVMEAFWGSVQGTKPFTRVKKESISIYADFLSEKPSVRTEITFSIALWQVMATLIHAGGTALSIENERRKNETKEEKAARRVMEAQNRAEIIKELKNQK